MFHTYTATVSSLHIWSAYAKQTKNGYKQTQLFTAISHTGLRSKVNSPCCSPKIFAYKWYFIYMPETLPVWILKWHMYRGKEHSPIGGMYIVSEKQASNSLRISHRLRSYADVDDGECVNPTPASQMYSQLSIVDMSSGLSWHTHTHTCTHNCPLSTRPPLCPHTHTRTHNCPLSTCPSLCPDTHTRTHNCPLSTCPPLCPHTHTHVLTTVNCRHVLRIVLTQTCICAIFTYLHSDTPSMSSYYVQNITILHDTIRHVTCHICRQLCNMAVTHPSPVKDT